MTPEQEQEKLRRMAERSMATDLVHTANELDAARAEAVLAFAATLPNYFEDLSEGCTTQPSEYAADYITAQGWLPQGPKE